MRGVRFSKAEAEVIRVALGRLCSPWGSSGADEKSAAKVLAKLKAAEESPAGVSPGPLETALVSAARGKVVPIPPSPAAYGRVSRQAVAVGATAEDAKAIGEWMARQAWLLGPQTLLDVLNKWPQWLAKARASEPPPTAPSGFGVGAEKRDGEPEGDLGHPGQATPGRLRAGFGRH